MTRQGSVLVIGASRGIGLELVRQYATAGWDVHATTRTAEPGLLGEVDGAVQLHQLDVRDRAQVDALVSWLPEHGLDVVIHNAGIYRGHTRDQLMEVNAEAPMRVVQAVSVAGRIVEEGTGVGRCAARGSRRGRTGSLGDSGDSKPALTDEFRLRAPAWELAGVIGIVMHPGWGRTDMGGSGATLSVGESATGIRRVIAGLSSADHGRFYNWDGTEQPW